MCVFYCATQMMLSAGTISTCEWTNGKGAVKSSRFGLQSLYLCCLFCSGKLNKGQVRFEVRGSKGGKIKIVSTTFFFFFYFIFPIMKVSSYNSILDFFFSFMTSCPHNSVWGIWQQHCLRLLKLLAVLVWGRNRHSVCGSLCLLRSSEL